MRTLFGIVLLLLGVSVTANASVRGMKDNIEFIPDQAARVLQNLVYVGLNPANLSQCEGDCDVDDDCMDDLVCYHKVQGGSGIVPGCNGTDTSRTDFCIDPLDFNETSIPSEYPSSAPLDFSTLENFKLKLYWEEGYYWQEETFERKWCMRCRGGLCHLDEKIYIEECDSMGVQWFDFVYINSVEVLIQLHGTNKCLQRENKDIFVKSCDENVELQQWMAKRGDFDEYRFEISQNSLSNFCITQRHHPKWDEEVELETCEGARTSDTSYWERCYTESC